MNYGRLKTACYTTSMSMSVAANISPLLFITFRNFYDISYSLLGLLGVINFTTQLVVDLIFSFFSHKFDIPKTVKFTPVLTVIGFLVFALSPTVFPENVYLGLVIGTVIFSAACGLAEVLLSPVIAAIPADDPDREMSKLHSVYAWGVVGVIIVGTLFLNMFGREKWQLLLLGFTLIPVTSSILFSKTVIPEMQNTEKVSGVLDSLKNSGLWLMVLAIFLGGAAECTMSQWSSGYLENALKIPKVYGDIFGVAMFGAMLGLGRSLYAKFGKNIEKVLFFCTVSASLCYLMAAISPIPLIGLLACAFTGFCTSMLWPGNLVVAAKRLVGGQLVGVLTDAVIASETAANFAASLGIGIEQLGMKVGLLSGMLFPLVGIIVSIIVLKSSKKFNKTNK